MPVATLSGRGGWAGRYVQGRLEATHVLVLCGVF